MNEDKLRERVRVQAEYQPQEAAVARLRAWVDDDARPARAWGTASGFSIPDHGGRLVSGGQGGCRPVAQAFPEAHVEEPRTGS